jgi:RNA polymerase sigma-70 factor (ECF subfamily)
VSSQDKTNINITDSIAIRRLKNRDIGGLEILIASYQVKAVRTAYFIVHDAQLAEDIAQDAFIRVYQRIRGFDESRPFEPYLMRSVINLALNAIQQRSQSVPLDTDRDDRQIEGLLSRAASVESQVEVSQLKRDIQDALFKLSPRQRAVIVQRYYLDMSEKEMAATHDAAPGTVKWWLHTARARLRASLGAHRREE